jgi:hypothetical protein
MRNDVIDQDGSKWYWENNHLHREDGPAVEHANGSLSWYINGKRHRLDGPAMFIATRNISIWFINGKRIPVKSQKEFETYIKLMAFI